jgi:hypothetical protein
MAVAMLLEWPGQSQEQYEQLMKLVALEANRPEGGLPRRRPHARGVAGGGHMGVGGSLRAVRR